MSLFEMLMNSPLINGTPSTDLVKRFTPTEIRETIQTLVATEQIDLANALGDAGLAIYPHSEDMLEITSLLAMMNQEWGGAIELFDELMEIQGPNVQPATYVMMVRTLRCNLEPARALEVALKGLASYPDLVELSAEKLAIDEHSDGVPFGYSTLQKEPNYTGTASKRLIELKSLLDKKLISKDEYEKKRNKIIDDI